MPKYSQYSKTSILPVILAVILPLSLLIWITHYLLPFRTGDSQLSPLRCLMSIVIPSILLYNAVRHKKLDFMASITAFIMGFIETLSNACMIATTISFFLAGTRATQFKQGLKKHQDDDHRGRRNWIQVLSNGGVGMELAILMLIEKGPANEIPINYSYDYLPSWLSLAFLGSIACACGDTLASELTPALTSAHPRLITNPLLRVPPGTNGGVTTLGLIFSALGGLICGLTYFLFTILTVNQELLSRSPSQLPLILIGAISGLLGSLIDSLVGAIFQFSGYDKESGKIVSKMGPSVIWLSGFDILDNNSVNLVATLLSALIAPYIGHLVWVN